jgi:oxygen tolerance protein BatD
MTKFVESWNRLIVEPMRVASLGCPSDRLCRFNGLAVVLALCFVCASALAAPSVTASLDRDTIAMGESVTLTLAFQDANPRGTPNLPAIPNVSVAGVAQSSEFTLVNGQTQSKLSFNYTLVPTQPGEITIPAMRIQVNGQDLMTQPLKLRVQAASAATPETVNKTAFLKLVMPKTELYVGEALPVDINLYVLEGRDAHLPQIESPGFTVGKVLQQGQTRTRVGNQVFSLVTFKTYVAAARSGVLPLGPATMQMNIPRPNARRTIFGDIVDWQTVTLATEPQNLTVLPLPTNNVPVTFSGSVGHFNMTETASPTNVALGDPITVKVAITGQGLLDSITLPNQPAWNDFKVYPPNSRVDASDQFGLTGTKTFEQVVVPQKQEITMLPPFEFSFFDPNARAYRTLSGGAVGLIVRPTAALVSLPSLNTGGTAGASATSTNDEIVHIKPYLGVSPVVGEPLIEKPWFLALQGLPLATWLSLMLMRKRNESLARNPRLRRQREVARKIAEGLADLRRQASAKDSDAFFATVFRLLQEQLGERLDLPASAITEAVIDERLRGRDIREQTLVGLQSLFQICNQARYAPVRSSHELASLVERVETTLKELQNIQP